MNQWFTIFADLPRVSGSGCRNCSRGEVEDNKDSPKGEVMVQKNIANQTCSRQLCWYQMRFRLLQRCWIRYGQEGSLATLVNFKNVLPWVRFLSGHSMQTIDLHFTDQLRSFPTWMRPLWRSPNFGDVPKSTSFWCDWDSTHTNIII